MKTLTNFLILIFFAFGGYAQKSNKNVSSSDAAIDQSSSQDAHLVKTYQLAVELGDYEVAKSSLIHLLVLHPEKFNYLDSLARIYYSMGAYPQALSCADKFLAQNADSESMMEIKAASERGLNMMIESLDTYEALHKKSNNVYHAYQIAVIQYNLKRLGECIGTIGAIQANAESDKAEITINYGQGKGQRVPMKAALENLKGVINIDLNLNDKAKENFEQALSIAPDFELAKNNLQAINSSPETEKPKE